MSSISVLRSDKTKFEYAYRSDIRRINLKNRLEQILFCIYFYVCILVVINLSMKSFYKGQKMGGGKKKTI